MFDNIWFYIALLGWGSFAYVLGHNITTGAAFKTAALKEIGELKAKYDALLSRVNSGAK